jgi:AI-2E family transporter
MAERAAWDIRLAAPDHPANDVQDEGCARIERRAFSVEAMPQSKTSAHGCGWRRGTSRRTGVVKFPRTGCEQLLTQYIGPLVAVILPVIFATAQFESWQTAAIIFGSLYLIQFVIGNYLEPMLTGSALAISPFVMLFAFLIWDFLWGMPGAFIGLPVTIALFTIWEQNPSTRWIANLMSTSDAPSDTQLIKSS